MTQTFSARHAHSRSRGFSLIELLVVVAIVGIAASIAYPTYASYAKRASRAQAQATLLEASLYLQYFHARNERYDLSLDGITAVELPARLRQSPSPDAKKYRVEIVNIGASTFLLRAIPDGHMKGDECGTFSLTHTGERSLSPDAKLPLSECWR